MNKYCAIFMAHLIIITAFNFPVVGMQLIEQPGPDSSSKPVKKTPQKVGNMTSFALKIATDKLVVLSGEPINVSVTLTNTGDLPIKLPDHNSPIDLEYRLQSRDGITGLLLNYKLSLLHDMDERIPDLPVNFMDLLPNKSRVYKMNIADFGYSAIPAGKYYLSVSYEHGVSRIESTLVKLNVEKVNIQSATVFVEPYLSNLSVIYSHLNSKTQSTLIYHKVSSPNIPHKGVFYKKKEVSSNTKINGLSGAIKLNENNDESWLAWLKGDFLEMQIGSNDRISFTIDSIDTGLQSEQLYSVGWQVSMYETYFAIMGLDKQQRLTLSLIKNDGDSGKAIIYPVSLDMKTLPNRWKLKNTFGKDRNVTSYLLLETIENGISKVEMLILKPLEGTIVKRYTLPGITGRLEALSMSPISTWFETELEAEGKEDVDVIVDLLFKTDEKNPQMTFMRFSDKSENPVMQHTFPIIKDKNNREATQWTLSPAPLDTPQAIAVLENSIIARKLMDDSPAVILSENSPGAAHLNLELMGEKLWAIWVNPESGFEYIPLKP